MYKRTIASLAFICILLAACGGNNQVEIPTRSPLASQSPSSPTPTRLPPTPTATDFPTHAVVIGPASAAQVVQLANMGDALFYYLTFSPDGKWLVVSTSTGVNFYDATSLAPIQPAGTQAWAGSPVFSPDGKQVAISADNSTVTVLDVSSGQTLQTLGGQATGIASIAFSPDGKTLAVSISDDRVVYLWDIPTGKNFRTIKTAHQSDVIDAIFSPDGQTLATTSFDSTIELWSVSGGNLLTTLTGHTQAIFGVAFFNLE